MVKKEASFSTARLSSTVNNEDLSSHWPSLHPRQSEPAPALAPSSQTPLLPPLPFQRPQTPHPSLPASILETSSRPLLEWSAAASTTPSSFSSSSTASSSLESGDRSYLNPNSPPFTNQFPPIPRGRQQPALPPPPPTFDTPVFEKPQKGPLISLPSNRSFPPQEPSFRNDPLPLLSPVKKARASRCSEVGERGTDKRWPGFDDREYPKAMTKRRESQGFLGRVGGMGSWKPGFQLGR